MGPLVLFYRLIIRPLLREPLRTFLTVLAVALGVAVVLAIDLAGNAAAGSFRSSVETLMGDSDLEVASTGGVPDGAVATLATLPYAIRVRPRISDFATVADTGQAVPLIGVDLLAESTDAQTLGAVGSFDRAKDPANLDGVWLGASLRHRAGDHIKLTLNDHTSEFLVRGVFDDASEGGGVIVMDIATAQRELARGSRVDSILLKVPETPPIADWQTLLASKLPDGLEVRPVGSRTVENQKMLAAFRWNLRVLSYIALVVGAFLIYNTISVSVVRRRPEIGIVRALGASRRNVLLAFLGEAACFGLIGAILGCALGRVLASGALKLLSATVAALYVSSRPAPIALTPGAIIYGLAIGIGVTVIAAISPAREAASVSPVEAMARGQREYSVRVNKGRDLFFAAILGVLGAAAALAPAIAGKPLLGYLSALLLIAATAFAIPAVASALLEWFARPLMRVAGVEGLLGARSLRGGLRRTSVLVGALATAIAMMTSIGIMVGSFRQTVVSWMNDQLQADLYLRPAGTIAPDQHPTLPNEAAESLAHLPGVVAMDRLRAYTIDYEGFPATLGAADFHAVRGYRHSAFLSRRNAETVYDEMHGANAVIISEPFSNKHHLKAGDSITLPLGNERVKFQIIDIAFDYSSEAGFIAIDRDTLLRYLPDPAPSNIALYVAPGTDVDAVRDEVEKATAGRNILIFTNRAIRSQAITIFDRTFLIHLRSGNYFDHRRCHRHRRSVARAGR